MCIGSGQWSFEIRTIRITCWIKSSSLLVTIHIRNGLRSGCVCVWASRLHALLQLPLNKERLKEKDLKYAFNFNGFNLDDGKQSGGKRYRKRDCAENGRKNGHISNWIEMKLHFLHLGWLLGMRHGACGDTWAFRSHLERLKSIYIHYTSNVAAKTSTTDYHHHWCRPCTTSVVKQCAPTKQILRRKNKIKPTKYICWRTPAIVTNAPHLQTTMEKKTHYNSVVGLKEMRE